MALNQFQLAFFYHCLPPLYVHFYWSCFDLNTFKLSKNSSGAVTSWTAGFGSAFTTNKDHLFRIIQVLSALAKNNAITLVQIKTYLKCVNCSFDFISDPDHENRMIQFDIWLLPGCCPSRLAPVVVLFLSACLWQRLEPPVCTMLSLRTVIQWKT